MSANGMVRLCSGSSAIDIVGAMRLARDLGPGKTIAPFSRMGDSAIDPSCSIRNPCARKSVHTTLDGIAGRHRPGCYPFCCRSEADISRLFDHFVSQRQQV